MLFPDVFSSVYALSPATLGITKEIGIKGKAYKRIQEIKTREELITGWDEFYPNLVIAMGRAYTPNPNKPPFYADLPFNYIGDSLIVNEDVLDIWKTKSVLGMVDDYTDGDCEHPVFMNTGIPGSCNTYPYSYAVLQRLVRLYPDDVEIDWDAFDEDSPIVDALDLTLARAESRGLQDEYTSLREWLELARPDSSATEK